MSLRLRLLAAAGAVALVALLAADFATYSALRSFLLQRIDQSLSTAHREVERGLGGGGGGGVNLGAAGPGTFVELRDPQGRTIGSPVLAGRLGRAAASPRLPATITGFKAPTGVPSPSGIPHERVARFTAGPAEAGGPRFAVGAWQRSNGDQLIIALPLDQTAGTLNRLKTIELVVTAAALGGALALGWLAVRLGLRPLGEIERTAEAIADGELDRRVPDDGARTEIGRLARTINAMLSQIQGAFAARDRTEAELRDSEGRLRRFVADASHELRTPVAAVSAYAELFEMGASTRPDDLERVMAGIRQETSRMHGLIEELLLLARLDEGRGVQRGAVDLVALATEAVDAATAISPEWPIRLEADAPVLAVGDALRLRQVLDNLLGNVRAHTPRGTHATVTVERAGADAVLTVADEGPGFTGDDAERVFERFYRADASRSRDRGGSGLGLAIVAAIVTAHDGTVRAGPGPAGGAVFVVTLPGASGPSDDPPAALPLATRA